MHTNPNTNLAVPPPQVSCSVYSDLNLGLEKGSRPTKANAVQDGDTCVWVYTSSHHDGQQSLSTANSWLASFEGPQGRLELVKKELCATLSGMKDTEKRAYHKVCWVGVRQPF